MFSVIIRAKNEEQWIGHCIQSVIEHLGKTEIIIVDNNSSDRTIQIAKMFKRNDHLEQNTSKYCDLKILNIDDYSPGRSLNLGVQNASCKKILIISAHCVITKLSKDRANKNLKDFEAFFGNQIPIYEGQKVTKRYIWSHFANEKVVNMYSDQEQRSFFHNAFAFFNKDILLKEPFDEELVGKEDRYWANNVIEKHNGKLLYDPDFCCNHYYTSNGNTWKGVG